MSDGRRQPSMDNQKTILCLGEILLRLTPPDHELILQSPMFRATIAGAEANVAVALAHFGHKARMLTTLPDQPIAAAALSELRRHAVDVSLVAQAPGRLGLFYFTPGAVLRPSTVDYDRRQSAFALHPECAVPPEAFASAQWFHVSGVTPALGRNCATVAIRAARDAATAGLKVSFDGNFRSKLWEGWADEAPAILRDILEAANVLFGDERDIGLILGRNYDDASTTDRRRRAVEDAFSTFPKLEMIACTSRAASSASAQGYGASLYTHTDHFNLPPAELVGIADRLGTGDAFAAGIIHGCLTSMPLERTLAFAHAAACMKHSVFGDFLAADAVTVAAAIGNTMVDVRR